MGRYCLKPHPVYFNSFPMRKQANPSSSKYDVEDEDSDYSLALELSKSQSEVGINDDLNEPKSIMGVVKNLVKKYPVHVEHFPMVVRRSNVLNDALRRMQRLIFVPEKTLQVEFVGEDGQDTGGLTREFFRLVGYDISCKYLDSVGAFVHNSVALQDGVYSRLGTLVSMALVQGGGALRLFCPSVFHFLCGMSPTEIVVGLDEISEESTKAILEEIRDSPDDESLRKVAMTNVDLLLECGFTKAINQLQMKDKLDIIHTITLHKVILVSLAELTDFREGLGALGVLNALKQHSYLLQPFFCNDALIKLTTDDIRTMFKTIRYSEKGSNDRVKEEATFMFFMDYLDDCERAPNVGSPTTEESNSIVTLSTVMSFFTGSDSIPPLGLPDAVLSFNKDNMFPTASTCALELTLPTKLLSYDEFKHKCDIAFTMHGGFGLK